MKAVQIMMDERLLDAIKALEVYAECFEKTNMISKLRSTRETIQLLKVIAFDTAEHDTTEQIQVDDPDGDQFTDESDLLKLTDPIIDDETIHNH